MGDFISPLYPGYGSPKNPKSETNNQVLTQEVLTRILKPIASS
jgi:hypothetical protein